MTTRLSMRSQAIMLASAFLLNMHSGFAAEVNSATRYLDAANHAELAAEVTADGVVRVALLDDRIERVVRAPGGYAVEHDAAAGDLYLRPVPEPAEHKGPMVLFVGSESGFTYRLTLIPTSSGPAQILIRRRETKTADPLPQVPGDARIAAITGLIRAIAGGALPEGYSIKAPDQDPDVSADIVPIEIWRGPVFEAVMYVLGADAPADAPAVAAQVGRAVLAVWITELGAGMPANGRFAAGRLAVVVREAGER